LLEVHGRFTSSYTTKEIDLDSRMKTLSLQEEYLKRHRSKIRPVLFKSKTCVFLKLKNAHYKNPKWRILSFTWREQERHPGFFEANYCQVIYNSYATKSFTNELLSDTLYWDAYEIMVRKLIQSIQKENFVAIPMEEQALAAWEVFLYVADSKLAKSFDPCFYTSLETSIRKDLSLQQRLKACRDCQLHLNQCDSFLYDVWFHQFFGLEKITDSEWLVDLINE